jgi:hypothetical protein
VALEALEDRVVFGIDRKDADVLLGCAGGDDFTGHDQDFLGGDREVFSGINRREGGVKTGGADDGNEDDIGAFELGEVA